MTGDLLPRLFALDLAATVAVGLALVLRHPLRRWLGPRIAYWIWLVVPVAMLATLAPRAPAVAHAPATTVPPAGTGAHDTIEWVIVTTGQAAHAAKGLDPTWLLYAWLAGAAVFVAYLLIGQQRAVARLGLLGRDGAGFTRAAGREASPALIGLIRPRIILPTDFETRFSRREQELILAHERTHHRHGHLWINGLSALIRTLNWFNPLVHLGAFHALVDQELACDAAVVKRFPGERRTYAQALLKSQQARALLPLGCHWPGRSPQLLQERLTMLAHHQPTRARLIAGLALVGALCLAAGAAAWAASPVRTTSAAPTSPGLNWTGARPVPTPSAAPRAFAYATAAAAPDQAATPGRGMVYAAAAAAPVPSLSGDYAPGVTTLTSPSTIGMACFSNSCGASAAAPGPRDAVAVAAAIKAGDAKAVYAAGGSPDDVLAAWKTADVAAGRAQPPGRLEDRVIPGSSEFVPAANGVLAVRSQLEGGGVMMMARGDPGAVGGSSLGVGLPPLPDGAGAQVTADVVRFRAPDGEGEGPTMLLSPGGSGAVVVTRNVRPAPGN